MSPEPDAVKAEEYFKRSLAWSQRGYYQSPQPKWPTTPQLDMFARR